MANPFTAVECVSPFGFGGGDTLASGRGVPIRTRGQTLWHSGLKGHGKEADFLGFLQKFVSSWWVPYTTSRAIPILASNSRRFVFGKRLPAITDTGSRQHPASLIRSRRLSISVICGVADSPTQRCGEPATPRITDTESRLLNFLKENSLYRWYGDSSTPRTSDTVSRRLLVCRIVESLTPCIGDTGVAIQRKNYSGVDFPDF